jgi:hypothetical protein
MGKIVHFRKTRKKVPFTEDDFFKLDLTRLVKRATSLKDQAEEHYQGERIINLDNEAEAISFFEAVISRELVQRKMMGYEYFACGNYISLLLASLIRGGPENWIVFEYDKKYSDSGDPEVLRQGADVCFLVSSVFPGRGRWRLMSPSYYQEKGKTLFFQFYDLSFKEIGYYMGSYFEEMAAITGTALNRTQ